MTVRTENNRIEELTTDGVVEEFDFDMLIHDASEVQVWHKVTGGEYTQLTLESDYGVVFTEDGGTVSTNGYTAPLVAGSLLVIRHIELTQQTNWLYLDNHSEQQHQDDYDRSSMRDIQLQEQIDRAVKFATYSSTVDIEFPEPVANQLIGWNAAGTGLENKTPLSLTYTSVTIGNWTIRLADAADVATGRVRTAGDLVFVHSIDGVTDALEKNV